MSVRLLVVERVALLRGIEFFNAAPGHVLAALAAEATELSLAVGDALIRRGEHGDSLYVVASGRLRVEVESVVIDELHPGSVAGELSILVPEPRSATVTAVEPTLVLRVSKAIVDEFLLDHPEVARGIITTLVRRLQERNALLARSGSGT